VERHPGKAYMRMGIVLGTVKGRDLSERLLPRQRGALMDGSESTLPTLRRSNGSQDRCRKAVTYGVGVR
jgi:hypothetical protein